MEITASDHQISRAAVLSEPNLPFDIRLFPVSPPRKGSVLLRTSCCTICGSDVHAWTGTRASTYLPAVIGHEIVGTVEMLGIDPPLAFDGHPLALGDRVTFGLVASCNNCFFCQVAGLPQKCTNQFKYGHTACDSNLGLTGGLSEYIYLVPGTSIFRVPPMVSDEVAATAMCAGATLAHALDGVKVPRFSSILLIGMGMLGIWGVRYALERGMERILCLDVDDKRIEFARDIGATETLNTEGKTPVEVGKWVCNKMSGEGVDLCIDLTGQPDPILSGIKALRTGGTMKFVGSVVPTAKVLLDPFHVVTRSLMIHGVHNYHPIHLFEALELVKDKSHHAAIKKGISKSYPLELVDDAFRASRDREAIRVAVVFGQKDKFGDSRKRSV